MSIRYLVRRNGLDLLVPLQVVLLELFQCNSQQFSSQQLHFSPQLSFNSDLDGAQLLLK